MNFSRYFTGQTWSIDVDGAYVCNLRIIHFEVEINKNTKYMYMLLQSTYMYTCTLTLHATTCYYMLLHVHVLYCCVILYSCTINSVSCNAWKPLSQPSPLNVSLQTSRIVLFFCTVFLTTSVSLYWERQLHIQTQRTVAQVILLLTALFKTTPLLFPSRIYPFPRSC